MTTIRPRKCNHPLTRRGWVPTCDRRKPGLIQHPCARLQLPDHLKLFPQSILVERRKSDEMLRLPAWQRATAWRLGNNPLPASHFNELARLGNCLVRDRRREGPRHRHASCPSARRLSSVSRCSLTCALMLFPISSPRATGTALPMSLPMVFMWTGASGATN